MPPKGSGKGKEKAPAPKRKRQGFKAPRSSIRISFMRVSDWPSSTLRCSHGRTQQVRLLRCCWARSSSSSSRVASSNCCLLSVLCSLHLNSAIRKSLNRSGAIRVAMTTILCVGWPRIYIFRGPRVCAEDRRHATY